MPLNSSQLAPIREDLFVDPVTVQPQLLYVAREERLNYLVIDYNDNPVDIDSIAITSVASADADPGGAPSTVDYQITKAPQSGLTLGQFQLVIPASQNKIGDAPGTVRCDILIDGLTRITWHTRLVLSDAIGA